MALISNVKTATNKRLLISESHDDSNRGTPCRGKCNQHDTYASYANPHMPDVSFLWAVLVHGNLSLVIDGFGRIPLLPRKKAANIIHSSSADRSTGPYPVSLSNQPINEALNWSQASIDDKLLGLLGLYQQHTISTFNTCSWGPTHRSLTDTRRGYILGGAVFLHITPWPFKPVVSPFHPRAPLSLQFNHEPSIKPNITFKEPMATPWSSDNSAIYRGLHLLLAIANDLSLAVIFNATRISIQLL
jgi:hypothetical protein